MQLKYHRSPDNMCIKRPGVDRCAIIKTEYRWKEACELATLYQGFEGMKVSSIWKSNTAMTGGVSFFFFF
jgi:hypothetical protein